MLKVMTLNINYYGTKYGPWTERRRLIGDVIQAAGPDIVALQAAQQDPTQEEGSDQATQLARQLAPPYPNVVFQPAMHHADGRVDGQALLSRLPFAALDSRPLTSQPGPDDTNRRVLLKAEFDLSNSSLCLFNGHFSWVPSQNLTNVEEALPFMKGCSGPAMLVGDLNATADQEGMQRLSQAGWSDAWTMLRLQSAGYTFEADQPRLRIDYAWLNPALKPHLAAIEVVADQPGSNGVRASDHLGLLITLDLDR